MAQGKGQSAVREGLRVKEPPMYDVVMFNDDVTTMDFVVFVLRRVFFRTEADAVALMLTIHTEGQCVVGTYTFDIAKSKAAVATRMARAESFPLKVNVRKKG